MRDLAPQKFAPFGIGCASYTTGSRQSAKHISHVIEHGARHFDTAPSYGHGTSERALGQAVAPHRYDVTITTKAGLIAPSASARYLRMRDALAPLRRIRRAVMPRAEVNPARRTCFEPQVIRQSLEDSLCNLSRDYVDAFLLHMPQLSDITDELLAFHFDVIQHEWCVYDPVPTCHPHSHLFTHRALFGAFRKMSKMLKREPHMRRELSDDIGLDISRPANLARGLIAAARAANPDGTVLFSARTLHRLIDNIDAAADPNSLALGQRFLTALDRINLREDHA